MSYGCGQRVDGFLLSKLRIQHLTFTQMESSLEAVSPDYYTQCRHGAGAVGKMGKTGEDRSPRVDALCTEHEGLHASVEGSTRVLARF